MKPEVGEKYTFFWDGTNDISGSIVIIIDDEIAKKFNKKRYEQMISGTFYHKDTCTLIKYKDSRTWQIGWISTKSLVPLNPATKILYKVDKH